MEKEELFRNTTIMNKEIYDEINVLLRKKRKKNRFFGWKKRLCLILCLMTVIGFFFKLYENLIILAILTIILHVIVQVLLKSFVYSEYPYYVGEPCEQEWIFYDTGIEILHEYGYFFEKFGVFENFEETQNYFYLHYGGNKNYFPVLKSGFTVGEADSFREFIGTKIGSTVENNENIYQVNPV